VAVPEAGILLPVPSSWQTIGAAELADPTVQADLAASYPGAAELLAAVDDLDGWAAPALLAVDPAAAGTSGAPAASLSVLVSQPAVAGPLLDLAAGFICDALADLLATSSTVREREQLPVGEAVRCPYDLPAGVDGPRIAEAWVIGAPDATLLVTLIGRASALDGLTAAAVAGAIVPLEPATP
jgi:hypothetical protein